MRARWLSSRARTRPATCGTPTVKNRDLCRRHRRESRACPACGAPRRRAAAVRRCACGSATISRDFAGCASNQSRARAIAEPDSDSVAGAKYLRTYFASAGNSALSRSSLRDECAASRASSRRPARAVMHRVEREHAPERGARARKRGAIVGTHLRRRAFGGREQGARRCRRRAPAAACRWHARPRWSSASRRRCRVGAGE